MEADPVDQRNRDRLHDPHPSRFSPDAVGYAESIVAHEAAMADGQAGYIDPTSGLFVMTASHLAERPCCGQGCRHCPWLD